jgi:signal transduction histidine kinase/DNA-binding response OmpR family regulator
MNMPLNSRSCILIVDDTLDNLRVLTRLLRDAGHEVRAVTTGAMALTVVSTLPPDLILLDIYMPEMNGYEVCQTLKQDDRARHIPIIFLTALSDISHKVKAFECGGVDYITKPFEATEVLVRVQTQLELRRAQLQLQQLNAALEQQVAARTVQLQLAYEFEATLKRITDKVRDSLDEEQIMQAAVQELATAVGALCCNAALYDLEHGTSTIQYEHTTLPHSSVGRLSLLTNYPEIYSQLLQGQTCQFCSIVPNPLRGHVSMLACPIQDDQSVLGDLWLINHSEAAFSVQDIGLVAQVANQCAIALRQARLYQAAQAQVAELQRLNRLKDDFLSTVSHELRTPMASVLMATNMLEVCLTQAGLLDGGNQPINRYFQILKDQCRQEIKLIDNLLDLTHLDSDSDSLTSTPVDLSALLTFVVNPFIELAQTKQQQLQMQLPPTLSPLQTDRAYLERILTELLNNAIKYTPAGNIITLSVEPDVASAADACLIRVTNTGIEIPIQEHDRIFERFYRIPSHDPWKHSGTGLGLALVKKLVDRLGGQIWVESAPDQTSFVLKLTIAHGNPLGNLK